MNALFQKISGDARHHTIELISFEPAVEIYFEDWNMRLVDLYDLPMNQRQILMDKYESDDEGGVIIPRKLHQIFSLLLDAKAICTGQPWAE